MAAYKALIDINERRRKMKKAYETPKAEMLDFDYRETVTANSGSPAVTDEANTEWNKCTWRYVDQKSIDGSVCGAV